MPPKAVVQRAIELLRGRSAQQAGLIDQRKLASLLMNLRVIERLEAELGAADGTAAPEQAGGADPGCP